MDRVAESIPETIPKNILKNILENMLDNNQLFLFVFEWSRARIVKTNIVFILFLNSPGLELLKQTSVFICFLIVLGYCRSRVSETNLTSSIDIRITP